MTRQEIQERALQRTLEEAQDRYIRIENARIKAREDGVWKQYFADIEALLRESARKERRAR